MAVPKDKAYYKAVRRVVAALNSNVELKKQIDIVTRGMAISMGTGVSMLMLDSTGKKLVHVSSWKLPQFFLRKGRSMLRKAYSKSPPANRWLFPM